MNPKSKKMTPQEQRFAQGIKRIEFLKSKGLTDNEIMGTAVEFWNLLRNRTYAEIEELIATTTIT